MEVDDVVIPASPAGATAKDEDATATSAKDVAVPSPSPPPESDVIDTNGNVKSPAEESDEQQQEQKEEEEDVEETVETAPDESAEIKNDDISDELKLGTPLKLQVSATEDDDDNDEEDEDEPLADAYKRRKKQMKLRRKLMKSPESDSAEHGTDSSSTCKRKRYAIRRSGSEECLLGFDEKSGKAELVKDNIGALLNNLHEKSDKSEYEETTQKKVESPREIKKSKRSPSATTPAVRASPRSQASPPLTPPLRNRSAAVKSTAAALIPQKTEEPIKQHIVGDAEDVVESNTVASLPISVSNTSAHAPGTPIPKKPLSAKDDYYKKPFEYGWKRELVYRANMETSKDKADVYFITPSGKKLRTRSDIAPLLEGDLTLDHFSFAREPLGVGPELELVRSAKLSQRATIAAATMAAAALSNPGKRISKPKVPKGASPPPQGWTPTRALKTNNAALLSSAGSSKYSVSSGNPITPPSSRSLSHHVSGSGANTTSSSSKSNKTKKPISAADVAVTTAAAGSQSTAVINIPPPTGGASHDPCTMMCPQAQGQVPQLQCHKCLCLYHHECVGLSRQNCEYHIVGEMAAPGARDYICQSCVPPLPPPPPPAQPTQAAKIKSTNSTIGSAKSNAVTANTITKMVGMKKPFVRISKFPQTIAVVKGKKYVMVAKPPAPVRAIGAMSTEHLNDIENDLKQINESIRNSRKQSSTSMDTVFQPNNMTDIVQRSFATNFFANVSFAYDALLCILKYLKIHERPRAASVCKLWNLAAKDTSLWQTVRMKNSKISNWAGFAAALRRGETKHLDLRKMLLSSSKSDEMWQEFSTNIGTVYSLESIDFCRCSTKVVESLFLSNPNLRVLNAIAINDESYSLENIDKLQNLKELRLRTCEPGTLDGDLLSLQKLNKLTHLSLTSLLGLGTKSVEVLGELVNLKSLELGECGDFDSNFAHAVLPKLPNLHRLRLENGQKTSCCTLEILDAVAKLENLMQLEFVNFDIKPGFDEKLTQCTNIRKLLIIPTYISQSATTNQIVLNAVQQIARTLKVFTWGVTVELLRVTALYVDQCEESTKKEKHHFDECIPVMKPVPGAPPSNSKEEEVKDLGPNAVPQIEILPLDKVESILFDNLSSTKYTIVKVPYQATCKQQLVE